MMQATIVTALRGVSHDDLDRLRQIAVRHGTELEVSDPDAAPGEMHVGFLVPKNDDAGSLAIKPRLEADLWNEGFRGGAVVSS